MPEIIFGQQDADNPPKTSQEMINCYVDHVAPKSQNPIISSEGITTFTDLTGCVSISHRGSSIYVATQTNLYKVSTNGTYLDYGSFPGDADTIIIDDGINLLASAGGNLYEYDGSMTQLTDADIPTVQWLGFLDGFYIVIEKDSGRIWINETAYNPTNWNPLDFTTAEGNPDNLVWGLVDKNEIILFGDDSIEFFYNSGNADFPFESSPSGYIERGILSKHAAVKAAGSVFFAGNDGYLYRLNGYTEQKISTTDIDKKIKDYTKECRCFTWNESGHVMVAFKFPEGCHVFDVSTGLWHRRETHLGQTFEILDTDLVAGKHYCIGDKFGYFDDVFTEFGDEMVSSCTSERINERNKYIQHDALWLNFETGNQGTVMLSWSDDGGRTWGYEITGSLGNIGEYQNVVRFGPLGSSRDRVYKYSISDPYRRTLLNAYINEWL